MIGHGERHTTLCSGCHAEAVSESLGMIRYACKGWRQTMGIAAGFYHCPATPPQAGELQRYIAHMREEGAL